MRGQSLAGLLCGVVLGRPLVEIEADRVKGESAGLSDPAADGRGVGKPGTPWARMQREYFTSWPSVRCVRAALSCVSVLSRWLQTWLAAVSWLLTEPGGTLKLPLLSGSAKSGTPCERMHLA